MRAILTEGGLTDAELVRQHLSGDQSAFAGLYVRHAPVLLRFIQRRVSDPQTAEDLAHEAFARVFTSMGDLRDHSRFYPWLAVIARHLIMRYHRERAEQSWPSGFETIDLTDPPDLLVLRRLEQEDIERALVRLPGRYREVLELREMQELSYQEIAVRLAVPESTVVSLLHRARQALRREYFAGRRSEFPESRWSLAPALSGVLPKLTRARDRVAWLGAYVPEASAFCASVACLIVTVGLIFSELAWPPTPTESHFTESAAPSESQTVLSNGASESSSSVIPALKHSSPAVKPISPQGEIVGIAQVDTAHDRFYYDRDYARENMPYYYEFGDFFFGADPDAMQRDLTGTLDGDTGWMGDADPNPRDS